MVSLIRKFSCVFFMSALVLVCLLIPTELKAGVPCCKNGKISTCPDPGNGQSYDLSGCQGGMSPVDPVVPVNPGIEIGGEVLLDECTSGQAQYKPSGSCGTSTRTCCSNGTWSDWDGECSNSTCGLLQCWNGRKCEDKEALSQDCTKGSLTFEQTRTATCIDGFGWRYGEWTPACVSAGESCNKTCGQNEFLKTDGSCCCESIYCGQSDSSGNIGPCKCLNERI